MKKFFDEFLEECLLKKNRRIPEGTFRGLIEKIYFFAFFFFENSLKQLLKKSLKHFMKENLNFLKEYLEGFLVKSYQRSPRRKICFLSIGSAYRKHLRNSTTQSLDMLTLIQRRTSNSHTRKRDTSIVFH